MIRVAIEASAVPARLTGAGVYVARLLAAMASRQDVEADPGEFVDSYRPGSWLDPGPYGCLGTGLGYAIAARVARPSAQVVLLLRLRRPRRRPSST